MVVCEFSLQTAGNGVLLFTNLAYRLAVLFDRMQKIASKNKQIQNPTNQLLYIHKEHLHPLSFLTPLFSVQFCFSFWNLLGYSAPTFISTSVLLYFSWRVKQKIGSGHTRARTCAHTQLYLVKHVTLFSLFSHKSSFQKHQSYACFCLSPPPPPEYVVFFLIFHSSPAPPPQVVLCIL